MKLVKFLATKVYNQFNFNFDFFPDVNILFGINGSGKTTVLQLINLLISGNFPDLMKINFQEINLEFSSGNQTFFLNVKNPNKIKSLKQQPINSDFEPIRQILEKEFNMSSNKIPNLKSVFKNIFPQVFLTIKRKQEVLGEEYFSDILTPELMNFLRRKYGEEWDQLSNGEKKAIIQKYLHQPKERPLFTFYGEQDSEIPNRYHPSASDTPLDEVKRLISDNFSVYSQYCSKLDSKYQQDSYRILAVFDNLPEIKKELETYSKEMMENAKNRINDQIQYFQKTFGLKIDFDQSNLEKLINNLNKEQNLLKLNQEPSSDYLFAFTQFIKLNNSSELLHKSNELKQKKYKLFELLIQKLNDFFTVTQKEAILDKGELKFRIKKAGEIYPESLSSGEQQILIFFSHLIFRGLRAPESIFLYDEPEISLHLKWQEKFVRTVRDINPKIQMILATHSPAIGCDFPNNQIRLGPEGTEE